MKNNLPIPTEKDECLVLAQYLQIKKLKFTHIANERNTTVQHHMALQAMGVSKGFPDYMIFIPPSRNVTGEGTILFIEMKRKTKFRLEKEQIDWINFLCSMGDACWGYVCYGFDEAKKIIDHHINFVDFKHKQTQ